jgi:ATP-binding cassette, subfamily B, multidrug efflux pump
MSARVDVASPGEGVFVQLSSIARPWRGSLALVAVLVVLAAVVQLAPPLIVRAIVDQHLVVGNPDGLLLLALWYLAATAGAQGLIFGYTYLAAATAQAVLRTLRVRLFAHLQQLPMAYYDRTSLGDAISRCTADVETVDTLFSSGVSALVANLVLVVTTGITMLVVSPPLTLVAALVLPVLLVATRFFQVRTRSAERRNRIAIGRMNTDLQENLAGIEVIRAFHREPEFVQRFRRTLHSTLLAQNRSTLYSAFYVPTMAILAALVTALLLWAGTRQDLADWGISVGTLTAFVLLFQRFFKPIIDAGDQWQVVQAALSGVERIVEVLGLPADRTGSPGPGRPAPGVPVEIRDVVFGYIENQPVLHGVRCEIAAGEQVALVGRTGAGKTTLLQLVAGLYAPWAGSVRVLGLDPRNLDEDARRTLIGVVPQTVHLFSGSVLDNLTLRDSTVSQSEVESAARIVGLHTFFNSLPDGYATRLGGVGRGAGVQFSAGQQQLLALARALVWNPQVILLDEATSNVDSASDAAFRAALRALTRERGSAVLTIAHRLATARDADRVIVLDHGRIIEAGQPNELLRTGGRFADMLELEASGWDWRTTAERDNHDGLEVQSGAPRA